MQKSTHSNLSTRDESDSEECTSRQCLPLKQLGFGLRRSLIASSLLIQVAPLSLGGSLHRNGKILVGECRSGRRRRSESVDGEDRKPD